MYCCRFALTRAEQRGAVISLSLVAVLLWMQTSILHQSTLQTCVQPFILSEEQPVLLQGAFPSQVQGFIHVTVELHRTTVSVSRAHWMAALHVLSDSPNLV